MEFGRLSGSIDTQAVYTYSRYCLVVSTLSDTARNRLQGFRMSRSPYCKVNRIQRKKLVIKRCKSAVGPLLIGIQSCLQCRLQRESLITRICTSPKSHVLSDIQCISFSRIILGPFFGPFLKSVELPPRRISTSARGASVSGGNSRGTATTTRRAGPRSRSATTPPSAASPSPRRSGSGRRWTARAGTQFNRHF